MNDPYERLLDHQLLYRFDLAFQAEIGEHEYPLEIDLFAEDLANPQEDL